MSKFKLKTMLICFFDSQWLVHKKCVPPGQNVSQQFYCEGFYILGRIKHEWVRALLQAFYESISENWLSHDDNVPYHVTFSHDIFDTKRHFVIPQLPRSLVQSPMTLSCYRSSRLTSEMLLLTLWPSLKKDGPTVNKSV